MNKTRPPFFLIITIGFIFFTGLLTIGCGSADRFAKKPLPMDIPKSFSAETSSGLSRIDGWAASFSDPELKKLIKRALESNLDLKLAASRVEAARLASEDAGADLYPNLNARLRSGKSQTVTEFDREAISDISRSHSFSLNLSWELDLWGRLRALPAAAKSELKASETVLLAARISIAGQTAKAWFSLKEAQIQAELSRKTEENFIKSYEIILRRYKYGLASALDVSLIKNNKARAENMRLEAEQEVNNRSRILEILLGEYPKAEMKPGADLPSINKAVPAGLPSTLLERRPDIVAARYRIFAADKRTEAAEKARLPRITLTASGGTSSKDLSFLLRGDRLVWNFGAGLLAPIFDAGRLKRAMLSAENQAGQAWLQYGKTVLAAFREVESTLEAEGRLAKRQKALYEAWEAAKSADRLAWEKYMAADTEIVTVLESRRSVIRARINLVNIWAQRLNNRVDLYLALGAKPLEEEKRDEPEL